MKKNILMNLSLILVFAVSTNVIAQDHLLLSEVVTTPTFGEYVEIFNATSSAIDLTNYYLTDATFSGGSTYYYNIVTGSNAGGGSFADWHARFPAGASIASGEYQTISLNGSINFLATFAVMPTYELYEDDGAPDAVPDMLEALPGSINGQGGLSNAGEVVILYYWDGLSDLVMDLDYVVWGDKVEAVDKTGISIDGPDGDMIMSTYLNDTAIASQDAIASDGSSHPDDSSFTRMTDVELEATGGNGITGHDETSEPLTTTWMIDVASPNSGVVPVELTSFTASVSENNVTLNWITATELNNSGFDVLRSTEENVWEKIEFVAGFGTTTEIHSYSFVDENLAPGQYSYRLKQVDYDGTFELSDVVNVEVTNPVEYNLSQNYPNPFNPSTTITFTLAKAGNVTLKVYNTLGEEVALLVNRIMESGTHDVNFDALNLNSGIYFYRIEAGDFTQVKKMTLLK